MILVSVILWALFAPAIRFLSPDVPAGMLTGLRGVFAAAFLFAIYTFVPAAQGARVNRHVLVGAALSAVTQFASLAAIAWGNTVLGQSLLYAAPVYALILGPLFGQRILRSDFLPIGIVMLSLGVLTAHAGDWTPLAIGAGITSAISLALTGFVFQTMTPSEKVLALAIASASQVLFAGGDLNSIPDLSSTTIGLAALMGIAFSAVPNLLVGLAIKKGERLYAQTLLLSLEPLLAVTLSWVLVNDVPGMWGMIVGGGHVLAVLAHELRRRQSA